MIPKFISSSFPASIDRDAERHTPASKRGDIAPLRSIDAAKPPALESTPVVQATVGPRKGLNPPASKHA